MRKKILNFQFLLLTTVIAVLFFGVAYSYFAVSKAEIGLRPISFYDVREDSTLTRSLGLPNVGVGEKVYLIGNENNTDITSYAWAILTKPATSTAALDDATSQTPTFTADLLGQYEVSLTVTNADGSSDPSTLWINAGTYVGVGTVGGAIPSFAKGQCAVCHLSKEQAWATTNHSRKMDKDWATMTSYDAYGRGRDYCLQCHSVGYNPDIVNGGFDDLMGSADETKLRSTLIADANAPTLDGVVDDVWSIAPAITTPLGETTSISDCNACHVSPADNTINDSGNSVTLRSVFTSDKIFILASWSDPTASFTRGGSWSFDSADSSWAKSDGQSEDRIAFYWPISGTASQSCMNKCHLTDGDGNPSAYGDTDLAYLTAGTADMWHSKAARSGGVTSSSESNLVIDSGTHEVTAGTFTQVGYMDDKNVGAWSDGEDGGRYGDAGTSTYANNRISDKSRPQYMETNPTDFADAMFLTQVEIDAGEVVGDATTGVSDADAVIYWPKYSALRAVIPERITRVPLLSRADVTIGATWKDGTWTVEIARDLDTGNSDDVTFDIDSVYNFNVAIMDNNGGGVDHSVTATQTITFGNWANNKEISPITFDLLTANEPELMEKANIQCENCHGPGSNHVSQRDKNQIAFATDNRSCNFCHNLDEWENSKHATSTAGRATGSCAGCHAGGGFIQKFDIDYVEDGVYQDIIDTRVPVGCATCHDPHSKENDHQLRTLADVELGDVGNTAYSFTVETGGSGKLCMNCHKSRRDGEDYAATSTSSHFGPHYGTQTDMLFGTNAVEFGQTLGTSPHKDVVKNTCATCHMGSFDGSLIGVSGALADSLENKLSGHSLYNSHTDEATGTKYDNVGACVGCHVGIKSFDDVTANEDYDNDGTVEGVQSEVKGMLASLALLLPPKGSSEISHNYSTDFTRLELKVLYNYGFVNNDGSYGVHNAAYAIGILKASFAALATGEIGAGAIVEIVDVPNDQGKQVTVKWLAFSGDGPTSPNITKYGVWRKLEEVAGKTSANMKSVADMDEMFSFVGSAEGQLFKVGEKGDVFDFIKEVPAAGLPMYSTTAPTVYDSTIVKGQHLTYFAISGHGSNNTVLMSATASGYSKDNLAPTVPSKLAASISNTNVVLTWEDPVDDDFDYFTVYRSEISGFTPGESNRVGVVNTNSFEDVNLHVDGTFFYRVSAFDFSGNESSASPEYQMVVTGIHDRPLLPTEFGLAQNYPNPFNPTTVIPYSLPVASDVKITIYNLIGQEVRTLVNSHEGAGIKQVTWNGLDNNGVPVSPGVYLYRIRAGNYMKIRKMVLVK